MSATTVVPAFKTLIPGALTVRVFTGFEPFVFPVDGELVGFDVDVLRGFAARCALDLRFSPTDRFDGIWFAPADGIADIAAAGIARFVERLRPDVAWSEPYFEVSRSILVHEADAGRLRRIDDFEERAIGFVAGSTADLDTRARAPSTARLVPIENQAQGMRLLHERALDGLAMGAPSNRHNLVSHPGLVLVDEHEFSQSEGLRFPMSAANRALLDAVNEFIAEANARGEIGAYHDRWMA